MLFLKNLREYIYLDIFDFAKEYTDKNIDILSSGEKNLCRKGYFIRILSYFKKMFFSSKLFNNKLNIDSECVVVVSNSVNEYLSTNFLKKKIYFRK